MMSLGLNARQMSVLLGIGTALWLGAALLLNALAAAGMLAGGARLIVYALVVPGTLPFVLMTRWLAGLAAGQLFAGVAVVTMTALLIDGVAVAFAPWIYGETETQVLAASAAVLWGAGVGLVLAALLNRPASG
jgi:hypothetical protein